MRTSGSERESANHHLVVDGKKAAAAYMALKASQRGSKKAFAWRWSGKYRQDSCNSGSYNVIYLAISDGLSTALPEAASVHLA